MEREERLLSPTRHNSAAFGTSLFGWVWVVGGSARLGWTERKGRGARGEGRSCSPMSFVVRV